MATLRDQLEDDAKGQTAMDGLRVALVPEVVSSERHTADARDKVWLLLKQAKLSNDMIAELVDENAKTDPSGARNNVRAQMPRLLARLKRGEIRLDV